ncbi:MAG: phosphatidylserine decarboxylase [Candidatus Babeliaceae bacterium]|jgi:phosphatidylserine decarboxylase
MKQKIIHALLVFFSVCAMMSTKADVPAGHFNALMKNIKKAFNYTNKISFSSLRMSKEIFHSDLAQLDPKSLDVIADDNKAVGFLYGNSIGKIVCSIITKKYPSAAAGFFADSRLSKYLIPSFIKKYHINMADYSQKTNEFVTLNDFFKRKIKSGVRIISTAPLVSPADSAVTCIENIGTTAAKSSFTIKGTQFDLEKFLGDKKLAEAYTGGTLLIFRLAPGDYHRFHFPVTGTAEAAVRIKGNYQSVHPLAYINGINPLLENERRLIKLTYNAHATTQEECIIVPVGALFVGRMGETYTPGAEHNKGDEMGYFEFGGSTVIVLFKKNIFTIDPIIVERSLAGKETVIKMGQAVGFVQ